MMYVINVNDRFKKNMDPAMFRMLFLKFYVFNEFFYHLNILRYCLFLVFQYRPEA